MEIKQYLNEQKTFIEEQMGHYMLEEGGPFARHIDAMRYSLFAGGKRIRPILCLTAAKVVGDNDLDIRDIVPVACALECIHTYSLIHDDLPAMDNDELRRGKPTNHVLYGEAQAILAGDGLLTWAFELISDRALGNLTAEQRLDICNIIAKAAGSSGMVGGQSLDILSENQDIDFDTLATIHRSKTGALITCSVLTGAIAGNATAKQFAALKEYGEALGLAFQIVDDLLNVTATTEKLGKAAGSDAARGKATYPAFFGVKETRNRAIAAVEKAIRSLAIFDKKAVPLRELATYIYTRSN